MDHRQVEHQNEAYVRELFRAHGLRFTIKRGRIFSVLASTETHPTAQELLGSVRDVESDVSLATVYNTLEVLTECGLCRRIPSTDGTSPCRYDADIGAHVHVVTDDGRVFDVPEDLSERILSEMTGSTLAELGRRLGINMTSVDIQLIARSTHE